jgi:hypothetical protein
MADSRGDFSSRLFQSTLRKGDLLSMGLSVIYAHVFQPKHLFIQPSRPLLAAASEERGLRIGDVPNFSELTNSTDLRLIHAEIIGSMPSGEAKTSLFPGPSDGVACRRLFIGAEETHHMIQLWRNGRIAHEVLGLWLSIGRTAEVPDLERFGMNGTGT